MRLKYTNTNCSSCDGKSNFAKPGKQNGILSGFLLLLLPKCPLCVIAYSSTIMLCSKDETFISSQLQSSFLATSLTTLFCLVIIFTLLFNYRDFRTKYAIVIALIGSGLVVSSTIYTMGPVAYYTGTGILFTAIWLNGSLFYFFRKLKSTWTKWKLTSFSSIPEA